MRYAMRCWHQGWDLVMGGEAIQRVGARLVWKVFMAAARSRARDLCVGSYALLEAMAVLHEQEQNKQCSPPVG